MNKLSVEIFLDSERIVQGFVEKGTPEATKLNDWAFHVAYKQCGFSPGGLRINHEFVTNCIIWLEK